MTLQSIARWHQEARPTPDNKQFTKQLGCHIEEFVEMLRTLQVLTATGEVIADLKKLQLTALLEQLATEMKEGTIIAAITDRKEFTDSLGDQIVTAVGAGYTAGIDVVEATHRINESNWSKFVNGKPVFNEHGKIAKPDTYTPADLTGTY